MKQEARKQSFSKRIWKVVVATALAFSVLSVPSVAQATENSDSNSYFVVEGSFEWKIMQGWYDYITNKKGGTDGVLTATGGARYDKRRNKLTWGVGEGQCDAQRNCQIDFPGTVFFQKHKQGEQYALDMRLQNLRIRTQGDQGTITVSVRSKNMSTGEYVENENWDMMTFQLQEPVSIQNNALTIKVTDPRFASDASTYFSQYDNEIGMSSVVKAYAYPEGVADEQGNTYEKLNPTDRLDMNGVQWSIIRDFRSKALRDGISFSTSGAVKPIGDTLEFGDPLAQVQDQTLILTYPGSVVLNKTSEDGTAQMLSQMSDLQLHISSDNSGEIYLTTKRIVDGQERTELTHIGTFHGKIYYDRKVYILHVRNAQVTMDPQAALSLPYMTSSDDIAPISFTLSVTDQNKNDRQKLIEVLNHFRNWDLNWIRRQPIFSHRPVEYVEPAPEVKPITVEEENAAWENAPAPVAEDGTFVWGVKRSWQGYVGVGQLSQDLTYDLNTRNYTWHKAATDAVTVNEDGEVVFNFRGKVFWEAYGGILNINLADIRVHAIPVDPSDPSAGYKSEMPVYAHIGNGATFENYSRVGTIIGKIKADSTKTEDDDQIVTRTVFTVENQPFYLHSDVSAIFVEVYRGGLRMDNVSFAGTLEDVKLKPKMSVATAEVKQGENVSLALTNLQPNSNYDLWLHSDPVKLTTFTTNKQGSANVSAVIPQGISQSRSEQHTLKVKPAGSQEVVVEKPITILAKINETVVDPVPVLKPEDNSDEKAKDSVVTPVVDNDNKAESTIKSDVKSGNGVQISDGTQKSVESVDTQKVVSAQFKALPNTGLSLTLVAVAVVMSALGGVLVLLRRS